MISDKSHAEALAAYQRLVLHLEQEKVRLQAELTEERSRNAVLHDELMRVNASGAAVRLAQAHRAGVAAEGRAAAVGSPDPLVDGAAKQAPEKTLDEALASLAHVGEMDMREEK